MRVASGSVLSKSMLTVTCASIMACMVHFGISTRGDPISAGVNYASKRVRDTIKEGGYLSEVSLTSR